RRQPRRTIRGPRATTAARSELLNVQQWRVFSNIEHPPGVEHLKENTNVRTAQKPTTPRQPLRRHRGSTQRHHTGNPRTRMGNTHTNHARTPTHRTRKRNGADERFFRMSIAL